MKMIFEEKIWKKDKCYRVRYFSNEISLNVLGEGLEPSRPEGHRILSPVRLPIPPSEQEFKFKKIFNFKKIFLKNLGKNLNKYLWRVP